MENKYASITILNHPELSFGSKKVIRAYKDSPETRSELYYILDDGEKPLDQKSLRNFDYITCENSAVNKEDFADNVCKFVGGGSTIFMPNNGSKLTVKDLIKVGSKTHNEIVSNLKMDTSYKYASYRLKIRINGRINVLTDYFNHEADSETGTEILISTREWMRNHTETWNKHLKLLNPVDKHIKTINWLPVDSVDELEDLILAAAETNLVSIYIPDFSMMCNDDYSYFDLLQKIGNKNTNNSLFGIKQFVVNW